MILARPLRFQRLDNLDSREPPQPLLLEPSRGDPLCSNFALSGLRHARKPLSTGSSVPVAKERWTMILQTFPMSYLIFNRSIIIPNNLSGSPRRPDPKTASSNYYTEEDHRFFIAFIRWQLKVKPTITKIEICEKLGEKVPDVHPMPIPITNELAAGAPSQHIVMAATLGKKRRPSYHIVCQSKGAQLACEEGERSTSRKNAQSASQASQN